MSTQTIEKTETKNKVKTQKPKMYAIILINDHYTTMDFVIYVLQILYIFVFIASHFNSALEF
mgnify:CR=1 FL=1